MNENKHRPDRIEVMGAQLVEVECACGWQVAVASWAVALKVLAAHADEENRKLVNRVAGKLFEVAHPTAFCYPDQPESTIEQFTKLAQHVLDRGYDA